MTSSHFFIFALGIGFVAGLRSMTAPVLVSWAACLGWLNLHGTPLFFMGSRIAVIVFSLAAIGEYINDKLPKTPSRTTPGPLIVRIISGGFSAVCFYASAGLSLLIGAVLGAIGALIGTFGGYYARIGLVRALKVKDIFVALPEDIIAIALAYFFVSAR